MPILIASALIIMGIILYVVDKKAPSKTKYEDMTFKQTFLIGLSQALAFIPGVSLLWSNNDYRKIDGN